MLISATQGVRDEIAIRLNEVESDNTDTYTNWINQCIRDVQFSDPMNPYYRTSADRTLSSGTRIYTNLPSDFDKMNTVVYPAGDVKLSFLTPDEYDMLQPSATEGGTPVVYTIRGQGSTARIEFYPSPGGSYTIHYDYQRGVTTVSASSSTPDLPAKYIELAVLFGEQKGLRRRGRMADSQLVKKEYEELKLKMLEELRRNVTENMRIKSVREFQNTGTQDHITNFYWGN